MHHAFGKACPTASSVGVLGHFALILIGAEAMIMSCMTDCTAVLQAMQVQNYVWGPAIMTFITAVANVPINMVLIHYYDFWGAALATSVARILLLVLLVGEHCTAYTSISVWLTPSVMTGNSWQCMIHR